MTDDDIYDNDSPEQPVYYCRPSICECKTGRGNWQNTWRLAWVGCVRPGACEAERTCCGCEYSIGEICPCVTPGGMR